MGQQFAAFDIDGTVVRTALFLQVVDELIVRGQLSSQHRQTLDAKWADYQARRHQDAFRAYNQASVEILFQNLNSLSVHDYRSAVDTVVARSHDQVYVYTRDLILNLKKHGYFLIALSGSEQYALEKFTDQFGFDIVSGDRYVEKDDTFTGEIDSIFGNKGAALRQLITEHGLSPDGSVGVGDSLGDASMLEVVQRPIAFNPEAQLLAEAKQNGWEVVIERKNVIYSLQPSKEHDGQYLLA